MFAGLIAGGCTRPEPQVGDPCQSLAECVGEEPLSCLQRQCVQLTCRRSAECPAGAACVDAVCQEAECETTDDCKNRQRCFEGDCRSDICEVKAECDAGEVCLGTPPTCKLPPGLCEVDAECPLDTFCKLPEQVCEPRCQSDAACAAGSYCDGQFCRLACETSANCGAEEICVEGRCRPDMCGETTCPDSTPFVDPVTCDCVSCLSDRDCPTERGERCSASRQCIFCIARADDSAICSNQGLYLQDGCCVECTVDPHCSDGAVCTGGRCVAEDPRDCVTDDDCAAEERCDLGWCVLPGSQQPCAQQSDCATGEACYGDGRCRGEAEVCVGCDAPGRCVAEPGDDVGTCAGCTETCASTGCPDGTTCFVPGGALDGYCAPSELVSCP